MDSSEIKNYVPAFSFEVEIQEFDNNSYLLLFKNTTRYFKISAQTAFILGLIDGKTTVETITSSYNEEYKANLLESQIYNLIQGKLYKLFNQASTTKNDAPSYLKLSTIIVHKKYVHMVSSLFYKLFTFRAMVIGILLAVGLMTYCVFLNFASIQVSLSNYGPSYMGYFVIIMIISTLLHEIGHASACRAFGADHGGIGIGFYLISPVMFADVTAAWELPAKERVVINLGGIYFEMLFSIIILSLYLVTGNMFFVNASIIILAKLLYSLNPFFRTDGYWVVSDYFNIPNLRKQSNNKAKSIINDIKTSGIMNISGREWFLVFYGLFNFVILALFFYYVILISLQDLIYLPYNFYYFFSDIITEQTSNVLDILKGLNIILIPIFFYYLLIKAVLIPLYKKVKAKYITTTESVQAVG